MIYSVWNLHYLQLVNERMYEFVTSNHGRLMASERRCGPPDSTGPHWFW